MPTLKIVALVGGLAVLFAAPAAHATPVESGSFDQALADAAAQSKPLLIDFYADWCAACKSFAAASRNDQRVRDSLTGVVLYQTDAEKEGQELAEAHTVKGYPTFILANADGETIARWSGYERDSFVERMNASLADLTTIDQKRARFEAGPTAADAAALARYHDSRGEYEQAVGHFEQARELGSSSDYAVEIFEATFMGTVKGGAFAFEDTRKAADAVLASRETTAMEVITMANMISQAAAMAAADPAVMAPYLRAGIERTADSDDPLIQSYRRRLLPLHALYIDDDPDRAVAYKKAVMSEGWTEDAGELNGFAWWCFEHKVNLREAQTLAEKGVDLSQPGKRKAMVLDTLAEICNALDDCKQAVELTRLAIAEDPDEAYYQNQLERFQTLLAQRQ